MALGAQESGHASHTREAGRYLMSWQDFSRFKVGVILHRQEDGRPLDFLGKGT